MARLSLGALKKQKKPVSEPETAEIEVGAQPEAEPPLVPPKKDRFPISGFKDPQRRPRYIIWTGAIVLVFATFMILALMATSTYWFCANVCHKVQDDTIIAYNRSSHNKISCMACHEPVNAWPLEFILKKAEALGELYLTATNQYELPLNPESEVAEEMPSEQCTQCHDLENRVVNASPGVIIDHKVHEEEDITCTQCHNRIAHREDFVLTLKNPDGTPNEKHEDFMSMEGCFRCHSQEPGGRAPGDCNLCHPPGFPLKPANHNAPNFYNQYGDSTGHWKLSEERPEYCPTCHSKKFCTDCHGVVMPHPKNFEKDHGTVGKQNPEVCANCHAKSAETAAGAEFCNACHHPAGDPTKPWLDQHDNVVLEGGTEQCFECHDPTYCAHCHVTGSPN